MPRRAARQPKLSLRLEAGWIIETSDLYQLDSGHFGPMPRYRRAAFCTEAAAQSSTATADHFMISGFFFQELEFVSGDHHNGCECATAGALTVTTVTDQLYNGFFSAFIPNALTGAASRKEHWNLHFVRNLIPAYEGLERQGEMSRPVRAFRQELARAYWAPGAAIMGEIHTGRNGSSTRGTDPASRHGANDGARPSADIR